MIFIDTFRQDRNNSLPIGRESPFSSERNRKTLKCDAKTDSTYRERGEECGTYRCIDVSVYPDVSTADPHRYLQSDSMP